MTEAVPQNNPSAMQVDASDGKSVERKGKKCPICVKDYPIRFCYKFRDMSLARRLRMVAIHRVCCCCLSSNHVGKDCQSMGTCTHCKQIHHSLLHEHENKSKPRSKSKAKVASVPAPIRHSVSFSPTLRLTLCFNQSKVPLRAVLDACSQNSYNCSEFVHRLKIPTYKVNEEKYCRIEVESIHDPGQRLYVTAKVHKMRGIETPSSSVSDSILESFQSLQLVDPNFNHSGNVTLVLGPEVIPIVMKGRIHPSQELLLAQYTMFGWAVLGLSAY